MLASLAPWLLPMTISASFTLERRNTVNQTALMALPECTVACAMQVLGPANCNMTDSCFCTDLVIEKSIKLCLARSCSVDDRFAAQRFRARTCEWPVRNDAAVVNGLSWGLFVVASLFVAMRMLSRMEAFKGAGFWWDDWSLLLLYALSVAMVPVVHYVVYYGFGQDIWELHASEVRKCLIWFYITQPIYMTITFGSKISLLLLYLRTWPGQDLRTFRGLCWSMIILIMLSIVAIVFAMIFQCTPVDLAWSLDIPRQAAHCVDRPALVIVIAGINILYDVAVIALPLPRLLRLDISWKRKLGLVFVFSIGAIVTVCSCVRIKYMSKFGASENLTWDYIGIGIWSLVEIYLSITCACAPATAGLLKRAWNYASGRYTTVTEYSQQRSGHEHDPGLKRAFRGMASPEPWTELQQEKVGRSYSEASSSTPRRMYMSRGDGDDGKLATTRVR